MNIFNIKLNRPKVKIFKGKDKKSNTGLTKKFKIPKIKPDIAKNLIPPAIATPGTNLSDNQKPNIPIKI